MLAEGVGTGSHEEDFGIVSVGFIFEVQEEGKEGRVCTIFAFDLL